MSNPNKLQQQVIDSSSNKLLVSASAGTGKTFVMVERICKLIENGADIDDFVLVTFTNLASAEMKKRLVTRLSQMSGQHVADQLEKIDTASISTLHVFCAELLRNYFYVVDIAPSFTIVDDITAGALKQNAIDDVFAEYRQAGDIVFDKLYKIFTPNRDENVFRDELVGLLEFSKCLPDFNEWYFTKVRHNFENFDQNGTVMSEIFTDVCGKLNWAHKLWQQLIGDCEQNGAFVLADVCRQNAKLVAQIKADDFGTTLENLARLQLITPPNKNAKDADKNIEPQAFNQLYERIRSIPDITDKLIETYSAVLRNRRLPDAWADIQADLVFIDKLVELLNKIDEKYFTLKKQRGMFDFNDLEHLALKILKNPDTLAEIRAQYKYVFVDEYQDTNLVQEEIVKLICGTNNLFMVGDVKQSIYGFRWCDPSIFVTKYDDYKQNRTGEVIELNENYRSDKNILNFVNLVFKHTMTKAFGNVDYAAGQMEGPKQYSLDVPSVQVDLLVKQKSEYDDINGIYDITQNFASNEDTSEQGELIAERIRQYIGKKYNENGVEKTVNYGDIVILMSSLTDKAAAIYDSLVAHNIPVVASFKTNGYKNKEVRDVITLLRAIENPYDNVALIGACLSTLGGFTENQLAEIKLTTGDQKLDFWNRLNAYVSANPQTELASKIADFVRFCDTVRLFSCNSTVDGIVLKIVNDTYFARYVSSMPNGSLRVSKLYAFIDEIKNKYYAQSITRFLQYIDQVGESKIPDESIGEANAVRLMTMHASKGLEYPVVIVAGLEHKKPNDAINVLHKNNVVGLTTLHYDFATMRKHKSLGFVAGNLANARKEKEESMRLLYVALTRAKFALDVVATVTNNDLANPPEPINAKNHIDLILYALKKEFNSWQTVSSPELTVNVLQDFKYEKIKTDVEKESNQNDEKLLDVLNWTYIYENQRQMPLKLTCSTLDDDYFYSDEKQTIAVPIEPNEEDEDRHFVGTAYHTVYQYVDYSADKTQIAQTIVKLVAQGLIEQRFADMLDVDLIYNTLNNPMLKQLLAQGKVYHEIPFMLSTHYNEVKDDAFSDKVMLQGVIDLLVVCPDKAIVVDFKYTKHPQSVAKRYPKQLAAYQKAVREITGIQQTEAYILSISDNKLVKM